MSNQRENPLRGGAGMDGTSFLYLYVLSRGASRLS